MIVKVRGHQKHDGWTFFADIKKCMTSDVFLRWYKSDNGETKIGLFYLKKSEGEISKIDIHEIYVLSEDYDRFGNSGAECPPLRINLLNMTKIDGTIEQIAFNTATYLMNDEGKTIERL